MQARISCEVKERVVNIQYFTCIFVSLIINVITDASSTLRMFCLKLMEIPIADGQTRP